MFATRRKFARRVSEERGQTMSEYMLTISVFVMAVVAAMYLGLIPSLRSGIDSFGHQYETYFAKDDHPGQ